MVVGECDFAIAFYKKYVILILIKFQKGCGFVTSRTEYQRLANNEALMNYPEYADRFKSIKKLEKMFREEDVDWALAYSTDLFIRGIIDDFHDLDVFVQDDIEPAKLERILEKYNIGIVSTYNDKIFTTKAFYTCKDLDTNIQIEFIIQFGMKVNQIKFDYLLENRIDYFRIGNISLPVLNICDLYILYAILEDSWQPKRRYKRQLIESYIRENVKPAIFNLSKDVQLPEWIWKNVNLLIGK